MSTVMDRFRWNFLVRKHKDKSLKATKFGLITEAREVFCGLNRHQPTPKSRREYRLMVAV